MDALYTRIVEMLRWDIAQIDAEISGLDKRLSSVLAERKRVEALLTEYERKQQRESDAD
jgi:hypothetical protein